MDMDDAWKMLLVVGVICSTTDLSIIWRPAHVDQPLHYGWPVYTYELNDIQ